jgi:hypothetical protein
MTKKKETLSKANYQYHADLVAFIADMRRNIRKTYPLPPERINAVASALTRKKIYYGIGEDDNVGGCRFLLGAKGPPATWRRRQPWGDHPPGLECGGFVELVMYCACVTNGYMFTYRDLRKVPIYTKAYVTAKRNKLLPMLAEGVSEDMLDSIEYDYVWIPTNRSTTLTYDAGLSGPWPSTVHLAYFRKEFYPVGEPYIGDLVFYHDYDENYSARYHVHVGIWGEYQGKRGLFHSSPKWGYVKESGPKFTPGDDPYLTSFLEPWRKSWEEWYGTSVVRARP